MGWADVQINRDTAGRWHVRAVPGYDDVFHLIRPNGETFGTWWPEVSRSDPPMMALLADVARQLNDREPQIHAACGGEMPGCYCEQDADR